MPRLTTPEPDEPNPPGITPNKPKDPDVYGTQWGDVGGQKPKTTPQDRPKPISTPSEENGQSEADPPPPEATP